MLRNLKKPFPRTKKKNSFCERKKKSFIKKLFYKTQIIHMHLYLSLIPLFSIFLTHYSSSLSRPSFPETSLCYALNQVIDVTLFFLFK